MFYVANTPRTLESDARDWMAAFRRLDGAYSENTLRGYRADFRIFEAWCNINGHVALPAAPETVAAFLDAAPSTASTSTLRRRLASIRKVHRLFKLSNPAEDEDVLIALRRAQRSRHRRPTQALGLTADLRDRLIATCADDLAGLRDRALISIGYDTLCRRSKLVALRVEDLTRLADGGMLALIQRAKNDPFGDEREGYVSKRSVALLDEWLRAPGLQEGWLFRRIVFDGVGPNSLHPHSVGRILKQRAASAGTSADVVDALSGHSMRVGAAQDMMAAGMGLLPIMKTGGWKSANVVARYVQNADLLRISASRL